MAAGFPPDGAEWQDIGLSPGTVIGGYRLEGRIGNGGMATVYRARDERLGRVVALKVLPPAMTMGSEFRERFIRESEAASLVDHPNIIPVYAAGQDSGVLYLAMRYVAGGDLHSVVQREGPLPPARAAALLSPIASALDAAHRAGIVHRDVKPGNVLVDSSPGRPDHPYLSDFGLAKRDTSATLTNVGEFVGTTSFAAPEQISGETPKREADQYALACVAFTMLTATLPFRYQSPEAVLWAQMSKPPPAVTPQRPDLSSAVDDVIARALSKSPHDRYPSCDDFAVALCQALGVQPYAGSSPEPTRPTWQPLVSGPRSPSPDQAQPLEPAQIPGQAQLPEQARFPGQAQFPEQTAFPEQAKLSGQAQLPEQTPLSEQTQLPQQTQLPGRAQLPEQAQLPGRARSLERTQPPGHGERSRSSRIAATTAAAVIVAAALVTGAVLLRNGTSPRPAGASRHVFGSGSAAARVSFSARLVATLNVPGAEGALGFGFGAGGTLEAVDPDGDAYKFSIASQRLLLNYPLGQSPSGGQAPNGMGRLSLDGETFANPVGGCAGGGSGACSFDLFWYAPGNVGWDGNIKAGPGSTVSTGDYALAVTTRAGDGTRVWNLRTLASPTDLTDPDHRRVQSIALSPDGGTVAVASQGGGSSHTVYVWSTAAKSIMTTVSVPQSMGVPPKQYLGVPWIPMALGGTTLAVSDGLTTKVYNAVSGRPVATVPAGLVGLSPNGRLLATTDPDSTALVDIRNAATGATLGTIGPPGPPSGDTVEALGFSPDGRFIAMSCGPGSYVWQLAKS